MPHGSCVAFAARPATASPPRPRQVRRRGARGAAGARAPERDAADERAGRGARDEPGRHGGHGGGGRARGRDETYAADIVVVSCGAANSAKLLLASASDKHPNGLANGSDQVGRNYTFHNSQAVLALSKEENPTVFQKTLGRERLLLRQRRLRVPAGQHPDGRQVLGTDVPRREAARDQARPHRTLERMARHAVDFWLSTEDLPRPDNRVTLDRDGNVRLSYTATNDRGAEEAPLRQAEVDARPPRDAR